MSKHTFFNIGAALVAAFSFLVLCGLLDGPSETAAAKAQAEWKNEAKRLAMVENRQEATITRVCRSLHGERALILQTTEGDWVCRRKPETRI